VRCRKYPINRAFFPGNAQGDAHGLSEENVSTGGKNLRFGSESGLDRASPPRVPRVSCRQNYLPSTLYRAHVLRIWGEKQIPILTNPAGQHSEKEQAMAEELARLRAVGRSR
jgi:hypothetical protein